jgi:hypothetical protein
MWRNAKNGRICGWLVTLEINTGQVIAVEERSTSDVGYAFGDTNASQGNAILKRFSSDAGDGRRYDDALQIRFPKRLFPNASNGETVDVGWNFHIPRGPGVASDGGAEAIGICSVLELGQHRHGCGPQQQDQKDEPILFHGCHWFSGLPAHPNKESRRTQVELTAARNGSVMAGRGQVGSPRRGDRPGKNHVRTARRAVPTSHD